MKGQSVARVRFDRGQKPFVQVHAKYAFDGSTAQSYAKLVGGRVRHDPTGAFGEYIGAATLGEWIVRAATKETPEKAQVERLVAGWEGVVDLEMGLPAHGERSTALRMDLVALEPQDDALQVVFWEAKRVTDSRLRSRSPRPEVMEQIEAYRSYLSDDHRREHVLAAYLATCKHLLEFAKMAGEPVVSMLAPMIRQASGSVIPLALDSTPRLAIFGSEADLSSAAWKAHEEKLSGLGAPVWKFETTGAIPYPTLN